jgi:methylphosphotriester-DNA--protein-cysteine methyltransferase
MAVACPCLSGGQRPCLRCIRLTSSLSAARTLNLTVQSMVTFARKVATGSRAIMLGASSPSTFTAMSLTSSVSSDAASS